MEEEPTKSLFDLVAEILPDNDRTKIILEQRRQIEKRKQDRIEQARLQKEKEEKEKKKREKEQMKEKERRDRQLQDQAKKMKEDQEQSKKMPAMMYLNFVKLQANTTPSEMTFAGLEFNVSKARMLAYHASINSSLCSLHLVRRGLDDEAGESLALVLKDNKVLRKMELEGNKLSFKTAAMFGRMLKKNKTLRYLDLESNQLTQGNEETRGMLELIDSLRTNKTLISLNVGNNRMNAAIGSEFRTVMEHNTTLIDFEFGQNDFKLRDIHALQEYLIRNKTHYDKERHREWTERKFMRHEDEGQLSNFLKEQTHGEKRRLEVETKEIREQEIERKWKKKIMENEIQKQLTIQQLVELAEIRAKGKKGRKGKGGKGKGKKGK